VGALGTGSAPYREGAVREERPSGSAFTSPHLSGIPISIISLQDLIRNKEAASRDTDRLHLERLRKCGEHAEP